MNGIANDILVDFPGTLIETLSIPASQPLIDGRGTTLFQREELFSSN